jgi:hypothetical protein
MQSRCGGRLIIPGKGKNENFVGAKRNLKVSTRAIYLRSLHRKKSTRHFIAQGED